jgi:hypothetical protein
MNSDCEILGKYGYFNKFNKFLKGTPSYATDVFTYTTLQANKRQREDDRSSIFLNITMFQRNIQP